jgi:hypothetical protein
MFLGKMSIPESRMLNLFCFVHDYTSLHFARVSTAFDKPVKGSTIDYTCTLNSNLAKDLCTRNRSYISETAGGYAEAVYVVNTYCRGQAGVPLHNRGFMFRPCLLLSFQIRSLTERSYL